MTISERNVGGVHVLDVEGPITLGAGGADMLATRVRSLLQQDFKRIVVNLAGVPYMDSAGLGELVQAFATAARQGGSLKLLGLAKKLRDLLVITKLATVFEIFDDETQATASFGAAV